MYTFNLIQNIRYTILDWFWLQASGKKKFFFTKSKNPFGKKSAYKKKLKGIGI